MDIIISGYGRMGKEVEKVCLKRNHTIIAKIDNENDWQQLLDIDYSSTVVIDFSLPDEAINNFTRCFELGLPIVTGTTGWYDKFDHIVKLCTHYDGTFFYAPNFSIGVNIFFKANTLLAQLMAGVNNYQVHINETHHIHKIDAPSGTAIASAEGIIRENTNLLTWSLNNQDNDKSLPIYSFREGEVTGKHEVVYDSDEDKLTLKHEAKNRSGFALGSVLAAEFILGKKGVFNMEELMKQML
ncbi:MAG: 4-hydroxy-tetrahydrodipicolinate reductase [Bacteroidetes bacterium]|nr:4-hydroxy-tetrahydrodipicolinate reductase [Bacteroidota bacterium]MBL6944289.1 4-hydroxy-tetrahydrodipicolinate reductase [Bacteroidales bacterium]